jgi:hypothetical protein
MPERLTNPRYWKQTTQDIEGAFAAPPKPRGTPGAFIENEQRPTDRLQTELAHSISPTMGAFGVGQLAADTGLKASEGDWSGVADNAPFILGMFAGPGAKTANLPMLAKAQEMAGRGLGRDAIWKETGWFQGGKDGKWRFEIDDSKSKYTSPQQAVEDRLQDLRYKTVQDREGNYWRNPTPQEISERALLEKEHLGHISGVLNAKPVHKLSDFLDHPDLFEAYPATKDISAAEGSLGPGSLGSFDDAAGVMMMNRVGNEQKSTMLHELQHAVQADEGFARGGTDMDFTYQNSPLFDQRRSHESAFDAYRRVAGEVEARNVQKRANMTPEQRLATPPWDTEDIPTADQILRFR